MPDGVGLFTSIAKVAFPVYTSHLTLPRLCSLFPIYQSFDNSSSFPSIQRGKDCLYRPVLTTMLPSLDSPSPVDQAYHGADAFTQHHVHVEASHWLSPESPIAKALTQQSPHQSRMPSTEYTPDLPHTLGHSQPALDGEISRLGEIQAAADLQFATPMSLHLSEIEVNNKYMEGPSSLAWDPISEDHFSFPSSGAPHNLVFRPAHPSTSFLNGVSTNEPQAPYSPASVFAESQAQSSYISSPESSTPGFTTSVPRSSPNIDYEADSDDDDDASDGKPYALLISDALRQAPGHRMLLRDIYDWFEVNTSKPRESGSKGWQNSIRHNLSMNKVRIPYSTE
jgi:Forkhead domain